MRGGPPARLRPLRRKLPLDRSGDGAHDLLYLDKDRDLDLTNDGEPVKARLRTGKQSKGPGVIELPYSDLDELQRLLQTLLGDR